MGTMLPLSGRLVSSRSTTSALVGSLTLVPCLMRVVTWMKSCMCYLTRESHTCLSHNFKSEGSDASRALFPEDPCVPPGPRCWVFFLCVWLSRRVRAPFAFSFFLCKVLGLWIALIPRLMGWRTTTLGIQCWSCSLMRMLVYTWYWSMKKDGRIALSCHFALDILCDKSEDRRAQQHSLGHQCPGRKPPQAFTRRSDPRRHISEWFRPFKSACAATRCWQSGCACQALATASITTAYSM